MNGIEQMLFNILQGFGIDPQDLMHKATHLMNVVETKLNDVDNRLKNIEGALGLLDEKEIPDQNLIAQDKEMLEAKDAE